MSFGQWLDLLLRFLGIVTAILSLLRERKKRPKPRKSRKKAKKKDPTAHRK